MCFTMENFCTEVQEEKNFCQLFRIVFVRREILEIRRHKCGSGKGLIEDMGAYVQTDIWDPVLYTINNLKGNLCGEEEEEKNVKIWVHDGIPFFTLIYYYLT